MSLSGPIALSPAPLTDPAGARPEPVQAVTILMATRNGAANLVAQLDSFVAQTHPPAQVIVSDDGSDDGTVAMLARFAADHPGLGLRIIAGPQRGAAANFLHLLKALPADCGIIAFADQDDVWLPDKLARGVRALRDVPAGCPALVGGRSYVCDAQLGRRRLSRMAPDMPSFRHALVQNFAGGNTMMLNAAAARLLRAAAPEAGRIVMHDWWAYQIVSGAGGAVIFDRAPLVLYRQHGGNQIGANAGPGAALRRLGWLLKGRFRRWNAINLRALEASAHRLTPDNRAVLRDFALMQRAGLIRRMALLRRLGLFRSGISGRLSLWMAVLLGRV
jgi:glycosyltransferase involved in cell wall biosynthesis